MNTIPIRSEHRELRPQDLIPKFLPYKKTGGISPRTYRDYETTLGLFFSRYPDTLDKPRESTLSFLAGYDNAYSFNVYFAYLKNFWDWMLSEGYFRGGLHPLHGLKKRKPRGRIIQLEEKEVQALLRTPNQKTYCGLRDYALMLLSLDTGIRPGEALQLLPEDLHRENGELSVRAEIAKTRTPRVLPLSGPTLEVMKRLLRVRPPEWSGVMWFNNNGHPIKSHEERNEVYDERKPQETELHERI